jgi:hypothetical protein
LRRLLLGGLARSSSPPTAASDAKDCDLPSKNLDSPLLRGKEKKRTCQITASRSVELVKKRSRCPGRPRT